MVIFKVFNKNYIFIRKHTSLSKVSNIEMIEKTHIEIYDEED
jgi:hypothetical protein